jgi:hypothetical protein
VAQKEYKMRKNHVTTFPRLRTVYIGPQSASKRPDSYKGHRGRIEDSIEEALKYATKKVSVKKSSNRTEAVPNAQVVIAIGPVKRSFGKPTLKLTGELLVPTHVGQIRRFLRDTKATSVAFALTSNQPYWKVFKLVRYAFDWSRKDMRRLSDEQKQEIRDLYAEGTKQRQLATMFGVSQPAITFTVTGYADHAHFASIRKQGFVTLNKLAEEENVYWLDAERKSVDLNIHVHKVGPMYNMVDRKDAKRLRASLRRVRIKRIKKGFRTAEGCKRGHPWSEENTGHSKQANGSPKRFCKTCSTAMRTARYYKNKRAGRAV